MRNTSHIPSVNACLFCMSCVRVLSHRLGVENPYTGKHFFGCVFLSTVDVICLHSFSIVEGIFDPSSNSELRLQAVRGYYELEMYDDAWCELQEVEKSFPLTPSILQMKILTND